MISEGVIYACCSDLSGKLRGKGFPARDLEARAKRGVGWTPTNVQITCFDTIADSPYGAFGDLALVPDPATRTRIDFADGGPIEDFVLGDIRHMDGAAWECCTRSLLRDALNRLESAAGVRLFGVFEHEFQFSGPRGARGEAFALSGFRPRRAFAETLTAALRGAELTPDTVIREFGQDQMEVTVTPRIGVAIADQAAILREVTRATAARLGHRVSFTPLRDPAGVGNGVHIHLSFRDSDGGPAAYDPEGRHGLSAVAGSFIAGILAHLEAIVAFTAPSVVSYTRLTPHRWSAAFNNLAVQDREAAVRICPVLSFDGSDPGLQFNFEFRAADAAASPYLQLAAIVLAGVAGIESGLPAPEATGEDLSLLSPARLKERGIVRLPQSLEQALTRLSESETVRSWFPDRFVDIYLAHKRGEIAYLKGLPESDICAAYEEVY